MEYKITKRTPCAVCGLDTFRHAGWFLVVENRWLDRLKILSWHSELASQNSMKSVCCREHLKALVTHWLSQASLRLAPAHYSPPPIGSDPRLVDFDLGPQTVAKFLGELTVHRESYSRVWSGSPAALECILEAIVAIGDANRPHKLECQIVSPPLESRHGLSLQ